MSRHVTCPRHYNKLQKTKKLTKSQVDKTLKATLKKQEKAKSTKVLITKLISLVEKDWEENQISTYWQSVNKTKKTKTLVEQTPSNKTHDLS